MVAAVVFDPASRYAVALVTPDHENATVLLPNTAEREAGATGITTGLVTSRLATELVTEPNRLVMTTR